MEVHDSGTLRSLPPAAAGVCRGGLVVDLQVGCFCIRHHLQQQMCAPCICVCIGGVGGTHTCTHTHPLDHTRALHPTQERYWRIVAPSCSLACGRSREQSLVVIDMEGAPTGVDGIRCTGVANACFHPSLQPNSCFLPAVFLCTCAGVGISTLTVPSDPAALPCPPYAGVGISTLTAEFRKIMGIIMQIDQVGAAACCNGLLFQPALKQMWCGCNATWGTLPSNPTLLPTHPTYTTHPPTRRTTTRS